MTFAVVSLPLTFAVAFGRIVVVVAVVVAAVAAAVIVLVVVIKCCRWIFVRGCH